YVINCAGVYADEIHNMVAKPSFSIRPRKGQYYLLDKTAGETVNHVVFQCPSDFGKGVVVLPTVHGNLLIGPDANFVDDKDDVSTTGEDMEYVAKTASKSVVNIPFRSVITSFSGLRATPNTGDFIIEEVEEVDGFFDVAGIESPGLSAAPAIGKYVANLVIEKDDLIKEKSDFNPKRREHIVFMELDDEEKKSLIMEKPEYGRVICRCENITEGEIVDAIHRNAGATTVDGIKRRVRPGSGRCQGGFCAPKVMEILARELGIDYTKVVKDSPNSNIAIAETK
ncbi:MAG: FAD-dependent oxidoreductase, partial [Neofamilia sp.]